MPAVGDRTTVTTPEDWSAAGLTRATARLELDLRRQAGLRRHAVGRLGGARHPRPHRPRHQGDLPSLHHDGRAGRQRAARPLWRRAHRPPIPGAARSRCSLAPGEDRIAGQDQRRGRRDRRLRRHGGAGGLRAFRRHGDLFRAGGMVAAPHGPALRLALQGGGRRRCLPHRLGAARADHASAPTPAPIPSSRRCRLSPPT